MEKSFYNRSIVELDRDSLYIGNLKTVAFDLTLPEKGEYGSDIVWKSGHDRYLTDDGKVTRPKYGTGDRTVPLCATFRYGNAETEKIYEVRILEEEDESRISKVYPVKVTVQVGKSIVLPQAAIVETEDGDVVSHLVIWEKGGRVIFEKPGIYYEKGMISGTMIPVQAEIVIVLDAIEEKKDNSLVVKECSEAEVKLAHGSCFYDSQQNMLEFLLSVNDDQMLYNFRKASGMSTKGAEPMTGWDAPDSQIRGHTTGHYLSALALAYQATFNQRIKEKAIYIVESLEECQNAFLAQPDVHEGFLSGYSEEQFDLLEEYTTYPTIWAPYYTLHKILAGLLDCYRLVHTHKALSVAVKLGMWTWNRLSKLSNDQLTKMWSMYIAGEFGGMNAVMAELYMITGKEEFLKCARLFDNDKLFYPMWQKTDVLGGIHANQHIPQIIGAMKLFEATGEKKYYKIAEFFWKTVVSSHCYANGGTGEGEMFHKSGKIGTLLTKNTIETCASYNMLKLTKELYQYSADASYMDYYERTLLNHILATQDEKVTGESTYFLPLGPGMKRSFLFENSCCHGTGMESRFKYREAVYFYDKAGTIYINLFLPSEMFWKERDVFVKLETDLRTPEKIRIAVKGSDVNSIKIRLPYWADEYKIEEGGKEIDILPDEKGYLLISRDFSQGTEIEFTFLYHFRIIRTPDEPEKAAVQFGPYIMAVLSEKKEFIRFSFSEKNIENRMIHTEDPLKFECEGYTWIPLYQVGEKAYHAYVIC